MLHGFYAVLETVITTIIALLNPHIIKDDDERAPKDDGVKRITYFNDYDEVNDFGSDTRSYDEELFSLRVDELVKSMWDKHHIAITRQEAEEALRRFDAEENDCEDKAVACPVSINQTRTDHVVIGHTMRPQTASLAARRTSRQKIC